MVWVLHESDKEKGSVIQNEPDDANRNYHLGNHSPRTKKTDSQDNLNLKCSKLTKF